MSERVPDYPKTRTENVLPEATRRWFLNSGSNRNRTETERITRGYPKKPFRPQISLFFRNSYSISVINYRILTLPSFSFKNQKHFQCKLPQKIQKSKFCSKKFRKSWNITTRRCTRTPKFHTRYPKWKFGYYPNRTVPEKWLPEPNRNPKKSYPFRHY